jgi:hypothetical protein
VDANVNPLHPPSIEGRAASLAQDFSTWRESSGAIPPTSSGAGSKSFIVFMPFGLPKAGRRGNSCMTSATYLGSVAKRGPVLPLL